MRVYPVTFVWRKVDIVDETDGTVTRVKVMVPQVRYHNLCGRQFAEGEDYTLAPVEERSMASHKQYFAALKSGFDNIPESIMWEKDKAGKLKLDKDGYKILKWPTVEHWRKWLLIETGWFNESVVEQPGLKYARGTALWIRTEDVYARIRYDESAVYIKRAKSQAMPAMNKADFEASKKDVLELNDSMTNVEPGTHWREAGMHA